MPTRRTYDDGCASAQALDLIGERWALLVVRELVLGPKRFTDLRAGLAGISPNVLTQRLAELEKAGIVRHRKLPSPARASVYELTPWGAELEPVILAIGRWGARASLPARGPIGADALVLSLRALFDASAATGLDASYELRFGDERYHARVARGRFEIARGPAAVADVVVDTDPATLAALVHARDTTPAAGGRGVKVAGSKAAFKRFLALFPSPEKARTG
jgi:DNA-binding HxlR family transcriptional regulator